MGGGNLDFQPAPAPMCLNLDLDLDLDLDHQARALYERVSKQEVGSEPKSEDEEEDKLGILGFVDRDSLFSDLDLDSWISLLFSQSWRVRCLAMDGIRMALKADQDPDPDPDQDQDQDQDHADFEHEVRIPLCRRLFLKGAFHAVAHLFISLMENETDLDEDPGAPARKSVCLLTLGLLWDEGFVRNWPPSEPRNYNAAKVDLAEGGSQIFSEIAPSSPLPHVVGSVETPHGMIQDAWCLASSQAQFLEGRYMYLAQ